MTDCPENQASPQPCGFGIFNGGELLVAFSSDAKARDVLQACEQDGYQTASLEMRPVFVQQCPPSQEAKMTALETELQQASQQLAAVTRQRDLLYAELLELRARL